MKNTKNINEIDAYSIFKELLGRNGIAIRDEPIPSIVMRNTDGIIIEVQSVIGDIVHSDKIIERIMQNNHTNYLYYRQVGNIHRYFSW